MYVQLRQESTMIDTYATQDVVGQVRGDAPTAARQQRSTSTSAATLPYIRCIISTVKVGGKGARKKPAGGAKGQQVCTLSSQKQVFVYAYVHMCTRTEVFIVHASMSSF